MRKPSAETERRKYRRAWEDAAENLLATRRELEIARGQLTRAQQETAQWRERFDALLARVPLALIEDK